jgi:hypothetical protein
MGCGSSTASAPIVPVTRIVEIETTCKVEAKNDIGRLQTENDGPAVSIKILEDQPKSEKLVIEGMHIELSKVKNSLPIHSKEVMIEGATGHDPSCDESEESRRSTDLMSDHEDDLDGQLSTLGESLRLSEKEDLHKTLMGRNPRRLMIENVGAEWVRSLSKSLETLTSIEEIELSGCEVSSNICA